MESKDFADLNESEKHGQSKTQPIVKNFDISNVSSVRARREAGASGEDHPVQEESKLNN